MFNITDSCSQTHHHIHKHICTHPYTPSQIKFFDATYLLWSCQRLFSVQLNIYIYSRVFSHFVKKENNLMRMEWMWWKIDNHSMIQYRFSAVSFAILIVYTIVTICNVLFIFILIPTNIIGRLELPMPTSTFPSNSILFYPVIIIISIQKYKSEINIRIFPSMFATDFNKLNILPFFSSSFH